MKNNVNYYESKEQFEQKHPYVLVETPYYQEKKCGIAQIIHSFCNKRDARNYLERRNIKGEIMTRKQAKTFINKWNEEYENGNYKVISLND